MTNLNDKWRALHGIVFLGLFGFCGLTHTTRGWPWFWLVPLVSYFFLVGLIPSLRRTLTRPQAGRITIGAIVATGAIAIVSSASLVLYQIMMKADLRAIGAILPVRELGGIFIAGILFPLINATLEELIFRWILFDAIDSEWGWQTAVVATGVLFGLGHRSGYPPGTIGACLAAIYGMLLGLLRVQTGGLLLPVVAHIIADATIFGIWIHSGSVGA
jgi:uncharacterized protein